MTDDEAKEGKKTDIYEQLAAGIELEDGSHVSTSEPRPKQEPRRRAQTIQAGKLRRNLLVYDGDAGALYRIWLLNLFLSIITLGLYSFWGRVRTRRYIAGSFTLYGDRFEYVGAGGELFMGFLKALPILAVLAACALPMVLVDKSTTPWITLFSVPAYIVALFIFYLSKYGAIRYRMNRTTWRGIRGIMGSGAFGYAVMAFKRFFSNVVSLGVLVPASDLAKHNYMVERASFGSMPLEFDKKRVQMPLLMKAHNKIYRVIFLYGLFNMLGFACDYAGLPVASAWVLFFTSILFAPVMTVARIWYAAALKRAQMQGLRAGPIRFEFKVEDREMVGQVFGNLLITVLTLGLGLPYVMHRRMQFLAEHTVIYGDLDAVVVRQAEDASPSGVGEGIESVLDTDVGLFG